MRIRAWRVGLPLRKSIALLATLAMLAFVAVAAGACSEPERSDGGAMPVGTGLALQRSEGARLYRRECQECHGERGDRIPVAPLSSKTFLDSRGDATLLSVVADGKGTMPGFGQERGGPFDANEVRAVVAHLNAGAGRSSTTLLAAEGEQLYERLCLSCHGPTGDRIPIAPLDAKGFLDSRTDAALQEVILEGTGAMRGFGGDDRNSLNAEDATAIASFLRYRVQARTVIAVSEGRDLYVGNCLACHGTRGDRVADVDLASPSYLSSLGDGAIISAISQGTESGPAFGSASGGGFAVTETAALLAYLKSWAGLNATAALTISGAGGRGEALFVMNCAPCHGPSGEQVPGVQLMSETFLVQETRDVVTRTVNVGNDKGMPAWSTQSGGPLDDAQVASIVDYLFTVSGAAAAAANASGTPEAEEPVTKTALFDGKTAAEFFGGSCAGCHGVDRSGGIGPPLLPARLTESDDFYFETISNGRPGTPMPSWSEQGLSDRQIRALVALVKSEPPGGAPSSASAETALFNGKTVAAYFEANCAVCHGAGRTGGIGPALLPERLTESDDIYFETISNGRPGTPMPSWSAQGVSDDQIRALVAFIKSEPSGGSASSPEASDGGPTPVSLTQERLFSRDLFESTCALCHGVDGLNIRQCPIGSREWLSNVSAEGLFGRISRGKPSAGMPTWSEQYGGPLSDEQIRSVASYLGAMAR